MPELLDIARPSASRFAMRAQLTHCPERCFARPRWFSPAPRRRTGCHMALSMFDASVPAMLRQLVALDTILVKAAAHAAARKIDPAALLTMRLYPDMFALT